MIVQIRYDDLPQDGIKHCRIKCFFRAGQAYVEDDITIGGFRIFMFIEFEDLEFLIVLIEQRMDGLTIVIGYDMRSQDDAHHRINAVINNGQKWQPLAFDFNA